MCCGSARTATQKIIRPGQPEARRMVSLPGILEVARFQYTGKRGATVVGAATGRSYRFVTDGAVVAVDGRDIASVGQKPFLTRV